METDLATEIQEIRQDKCLQIGINKKPLQALTKKTTTDRNQLRWTKKYTSQTDINKENPHN